MEAISRQRGYYGDLNVQPVAMPYLHSPNPILQDDNSHPHRAAFIRVYLQKLGEERMERPSSCPDLNPRSIVATKRQPTKHKSPCHLCLLYVLIQRSHVEKKLQLLSWLCHLSTCRCDKLTQRNLSTCPCPVRWNPLFAGL